MESNRVIAGTIGLFVVICLVGAVLAPMINDWATGERITNEGAGWLRMAYMDVDSSTNYAFEVDVSADIIVYDTTSGSQDPPSQTGQDDTIVYASSNMAVWTDSGIIMVLGTDADNNPYYYTASSTLVLTKALQGLNIYIDGSNDGIALPDPTWAYVPKSDGTYGFFDNGTSVQTEEGKPIAAVGGGFAGVYAYNNIARYAGLGLQLQTTQDADGLLDGAYWAKAAAQQDQRQLNPIILTPLDPSDTRVAGPDAGSFVRSVPTPTYTDGDWGYDLITVDGVSKAKIVSYSGAGGGIITTPTTVGGYDVVEIGKGGSSQTVFNTSLTATGLVISEGVTKINQYAFQLCKYITGTLVLPSTLKTIDSQGFGDCSGFTSIVISEGLTAAELSAFRACTGFTGSLIFPSTMTKIDQYSFTQCGFDETLVIPENVTTLGTAAFNACKFKTVIIASDVTPESNAFNSMSSVTEILDLSDTVDYSQSRYGMAAGATVQDNIGDALGYISFVEKGSDPLVPAGAAAVMLAIPVVILGALIVVAATTFIRKE